MNKLLLRIVFVLSVMLALFFPPSAFALDAPSVQVKVGEQVVGTNSVIKVESTDIDIFLTKTAADIIEQYLYVWNQSSTGDALTSAGTSVDADEDPKLIVTPASFFTGYNPPSDSNHLWYFHVKSIWGVDESIELVVGPFIFDTVAPTGTIDLADMTGQTPSTDPTVPSSSDSSTVTFLIVSTADLDKVYLSNIGGTKPNTETSTTTSGGNLLVEDFLTDPDENGAATVYVWYEDAVGNFTTDSIDLKIATGEKTMTPSGPLTFEFSGTQLFQIVGGESDTYTWEIVDADGVETNLATAESSAYTAIVTAGDTEGTFKVKAENVLGNADPIYSGMITIVEKSQSFCLDVDGNGTVNKYTDVALIYRYLRNLEGTYLTDGALGTGDTRTAGEIIDYLDAARCGK